MIRGIGPVFAKRMVGLFATDVFDIIEASPGRLREVEGIGPTRAARITAAWADQKMVREIMVFLHQHGVGTARAVRIFKTYGADAVQVMSENPYRLARDIRGIGFRTADLIAERLGIEKTAMIRVRAGISFALTEAMGDGHCGLPASELTTLAVKLLAVPEELIASALEQELAEQTVTADSVAGTPCVFLSGLYHAEQSAAEHLRRVTGGPVPWPAIDAAKALPWAEASTGLTLADSQAAAVRLALRSKATVITGGPGVGKTTIVKTILRILQAKAVTLLLCAPTGRAAKRMSEATGMEAKTIHRLLDVDPKTFCFRRREGNPLDCDLLVVDESSMVDVLLMQALLQAVPDHAALLLVGDIDQLPSVGPGPGARGHHRLRCDPGRAPHRRVPAGGHEPDRRQRASDQRGPDAGVQRGGRRERLLLRAGGRPRTGGGAHPDPGPGSHSRPVRARSGARHPGAVPDEPGRRRREGAQYRVAGGTEPRRRGAGRAFRLDLCPGRQGHADRERLRQVMSTTVTSAPWKASMPVRES